MTPDTSQHNEASPLSDEQIHTARDVGRQMRDAITLLLNTLPPDKRTAKCVADHFDIEGVVARRIIRAARETDDDLRLLTRLPSVENLRKVQRAAIEKQVNPTIAADFLAGVDAFVALAETVGGEQAKAGLTRRLRATIGEPDEDRDADEG